MAADDFKKQLDLLKKLKFSDKEREEQKLSFNENGVPAVRFNLDEFGMGTPVVNESATPEQFSSAAKSLIDYKNPTNALEFLRNQAGMETRPEIKEPASFKPIVLPELSQTPPVLAQPVAPKAVERKPANEAASNAVEAFELKSGEPKPAMPDDSEDLRAAQEAANMNQLGAALLSSTNLINQGLTLTPVDNRNVEVLKPGINAPVEAFKAAAANRDRNLKLQSAQMELENEKELNDPKSNISVAARNLLKDMGMQIPESTSAGVLKASGVNVGALLGIKETAKGRRDQMEMLAEERKLGRDLREEQLKGIKEQRTIGNINKLQETFNKDKVAVKALEGINSAEDAEALLDSNTPIGDEAVKRSLARLSGEVGVLTDQDVKAFGGSKSAQDRLNQSVKQLIDGKLTEENRKYMKTILNVFKNRRSEQLDKQAVKIAQQGSNRLGIDVKEAYEAIRPGMSLPEEKVEVINPDGKQGRIPKSQLESALSQGYKVVK